MTLRKSAPRGAQRWGLLAVVVAGLTLALAAVALAVHDLDFQLDGDVDDSTFTNGGAQPVDWETLFDANGDELGLPAGFDSSGFDRDFNTNTNGSFNTSDSTTFATGSKDTLPISPGWQCNFDNNVNSKVDIMNSYAATATVEVAGVDHEILYFALERNTNTGDANVAFWFLQDDVSCTTTGGSAPFTGGHQDGDLLAVSAFTKGGGVSVIDVYQWEGDDDTGFLNPNPVATGVDCKGTSGGDSVCATTNSGTLEENDAITTPWLTANKTDGVGHTLQVAEFFEGGIDLTASNLGGRCFNVFLGDTRSSQSLTATLFDYSEGSLGSCESDIVTTPKKGDGTTNITSEPIPATGQLLVTDSALVTVDGADTFDADVTFFLCREEELVDSNGDPDPDGTCATGGTQIGSAKAVTSSPSTVVSDTAGLTAAERYCWRAEFSGDDAVGVPPSSDSSSGECFVVTPLTPTLTTSASADVTLGDPISDTISLTGTAAQPGTNGIGPGGTIDATNRAAANGTISVTAFGPDDCTTVALGPVSINVSGDNTAYGGAGSSTEFTPTAIGQYTYVASYSGDDPNTNSVADTACPDLTDTEEVTVGGEATLSTAQDWLPNDTATIEGPTDLSGTATFTLFTGNDCGAGDDDTIVYSSGDVPVSGASPQTASTSNTTLVLEADSGDYSWLVTYDDDNLKDPVNSCEKTTITITD